jgi:3alpha(or 20beta)-hydroxysteroid dehydrogenase
VGLKSDGLLGLKHVLRIMIAQKSGAIVNTSSRSGIEGTPNMVAYSASKHAVLALTKTAALEVAPLGIRVNAVCPGPVATPMMVAIEEGFSPGAPKLRRQQSAPDGRYAEPEQVANLMVYLASDMASHVTGQCIVIDGGRRHRLSESMESVRGDFVPIHTIPAPP